MTTSGRSFSSDGSLGRRSLLLGALGGTSAAALAALGHTGVAGAIGRTASTTSTTNTTNTFEFDFDNDNFDRDLISKAGDTTFGGEQAFGPMDASIIIWIQDIMVTSWFDALAPYHPTAVGLHSRIDRRPASEGETNRNKNIAAIYATHQVIKAVYPERSPVVQQVMAAIGLDPEDESEDTTTAVGIGNVAGKSVVRARQHDGMNFLGDEGRKYNGQPFDDYTGYEPVNNAYELDRPARWQPAIHPHRRRVGGGPGDRGIFVKQRFVTPQLARVKAHTYRHPHRLWLAPPDHLWGDQAYKRSVDEVLAASAGLTDEQKLKAEFFDNKFLGIGQSTKAAARAHDLDLDSWVQVHFTSAVAMLDALICAWHWKRTYDAVRPFSAVRHVYGSRKVTSWGGVGEGTVDDMPADEWASYLPVGDHPEYPSGSTTLCAAEAQAARRYLGDDVLDWTFEWPAGSSLTEPGIVPAADTSVHWATWTDFTRDCGNSRVWGGVHFQPTADTARQWGSQFGDRAHRFAQRYINGEVDD